MMAKTYYVYNLTNKNHTVLYTGITNELSKRMWEHQAGLGSKFADRYRAIELVYFEAFEDPYEAISREKQIKAGPRLKKVALIRKLNPDGATSQRISKMCSPRPFGARDDKIQSLRGREAAEAISSRQNYSNPSNDAMPTIRQPQMSLNART